MPDFSKAIPQYLTSKRNILQLILFTAAFALVFINIYEPFGMKIWTEVNRWQLLLYSSLITLTGVLVVVLSRIILYFRSRKHTVTYWHYFIWVGAEVFLMAVFYSIYIKFILRDARFFGDILKASVRNTALVLLLPYSVLWLYFSWKEKQKKIEALAKIPAAAESRQLMLPFHDEKGVLRFSVKMESLLYIEASDNYVTLFYLKNGAMSRFMLRNSLKSLEESLKHTRVVRCHRRYMVNSDKVKVMKRGKEGIQLELDVPAGSDIPVSKTYLEGFMQVFVYFSPQAEETS